MCLPVPYNAPVFIVQQFAVEALIRPTFSCCNHIFAHPICQQHSPVTTFLFHYIIRSLTSGGLLEAGCSQSGL